MDRAVDSPVERILYFGLIPASLAFFGASIPMLTADKHSGIGPILVSVFLALGLVTAGGFIGLVLAGLLAWRGSIGVFRCVAGVAAVLALSSAFLLARKSAQERTRLRAVLGLDVPLPPPVDFQLRAEFKRSSEAVPWLYLDGRDWSVRYAYVDYHYIKRHPPQECVGTLKAKQAAEVIEILDRVRQRIDNNQPLCGAEKEQNVTFRVRYEGVGGAWLVEAGSECILGQHSDRSDSELGRLQLVLDSLAPIPRVEDRSSCKPPTSGPFG